METIYERFPHRKGSEEYGKNYVIMEGTDGSKYPKDKFRLFCVLCNKAISATPNKILTGQKPCACGKQYYKTPERKLEKILEVASQKGIRPVAENITLTSSSEKFEVSCDKCFHRWWVTFTYFTGTIRGCPCCAGQKRYTDNEYIERVNSIGKFKNFKFLSKIGEGKLRDRSRVMLECNVCSGYWDALLSNTLSGKYSCPNCSMVGFNPLRPAHLYLLSLKVKGELIGYKYGISNVKQKRLFNLRTRNTNVEIDVVASWYYEDGSVCRDHESFIKRKYPAHLNACTLPDGHTETVSPEQICQVFEDMNTNYVQYKNGMNGGVGRGNQNTDGPI